MNDRPADIGRTVRQLGAPNVVLDARVDEMLSRLLTCVGADPAPGGLLVVGPSGAGKSAVVGKVLRRLHTDGWAVAAHIGRWLPGALFAGLIEAFDLALDARDELPHWDESAELLASDAPDTAKLDLVCELLAGSRLALVFDDLGQNLDGDEGGFTDPGFAEVFARLCTAANQGRVIATCRRPLPGGSVSLPLFELVPTMEDAVHLTAQWPTTAELKDGERLSVLALLDARPRLLALAETWLSAGGADLADAYIQLMAAAAKARSANGPGSDPLPDRLRASLIGLLLSLLHDDERDTLLQAAVCTFPLTPRDIATARDPRTRTVQQRQSPDDDDIETVVAALARLIALRLVVGVSDEEVFVEPWIAEGLRGYQGGQWDDRHERAILMHYAEMKSVRTTYTDIVAIVRHLIAVRGFDDLTGFALDATRFDDNSLYAAALLAEVVPAVPADHPDLPRLVERQIAKLRAGGLPEPAQQVADRFR